MLDRLTNMTFSFSALITFNHLLKKKRTCRQKSSRIEKEFNEKIRPLEDELSTIIKKLETNLSKLEGSAPLQTGNPRNSDAASLEHQSKNCSVQILKKALNHEILLKH